MKVKVPFHARLETWAHEILAEHGPEFEAVHDTARECLEKLARMRATDDPRERDELAHELGFLEGKMYTELNWEEAAHHGMRMSRGKGRSEHAKIIDEIDRSMPPGTPAYEIADQLVARGHAKAINRPDDKAAYLRFEDGAEIELASSFPSTLSRLRRARK